MSPGLSLSVQSKGAAISTTSDWFNSCKSPGEFDSSSARLYRLDHASVHVGVRRIHLTGQTETYRNCRCNHLASGSARPGECTFSFFLGGGGRGGVCLYLPVYLCEVALTLRLGTRARVFAGSTSNAKERDYRRSYIGFVKDAVLVDSDERWQLVL